MNHKTKLVAIALLIALAQTMAFEDVAHGAGEVLPANYEDLGCITDTDCEALYAQECEDDEECAQGRGDDL